MARQEHDPQALADGQAIARLVGREHVLYRQVNWTWRSGRVYQLMDGKKIVCTGKGDNTKAQWA